jgi:hypothetical protein
LCGRDAALRSTRTLDGMDAALATLDDSGFLTVPHVLAPEQCEALAEIVSPGLDAGSRNLLEYVWCQDLAVGLKHHAGIEPHLPEGALAVQCTLFDKSPERNWLVAPHQDLSIPVRDRVESPACSGWSVKEGVTFVQPPTAVLAGLVAVRVHLDDCGAANGPLRVVPGSHRYGRLTAADARGHRQSDGEVTCTLRRGDALLLRPLLLHASSKATSDLPRRILHFLFGPPLLPFGLRWHHAV